MARNWLKGISNGTYPYAHRRLQSGFNWWVDDGNLASTTAFAVTQFAYDALNRLTSASTSPAATANATTTIAIADPLPIKLRTTSSWVTSDAFFYTVPSGGTNKLLIAMIALGAENPRHCR